ncbi:hypothetical protein O3M35_004681 [Rhynocoris fuscipes]|uniref:Protein SEC13 homolog n=1 Tax=Rhynocoris fuscipes TaxID=488301 RepID=A0AAW1CIC2_9HEMI
MVTLLNIIDTVHDDIIHDAVIDFYGVQLATCSSDNSIKIFNVKEGTFNHVTDLKGHFGPVWQLSWAHPKFGNILASCSFDKRLIIWKENREWTKIFEYKAHEGSVNSVAFGPHEFGLTLACGSADGAVSILTFKGKLNKWEAQRIPNAHNIGVNAVSWAPYVSLNSVFSHKYLGNNQSKPLQRIVTAGCDFLIKIWIEVKGRWEEVVRLTNHCDWVRDVAWSPPTSIVTRIASSSQDKKVIIWSSEDDLHWESYELPVFDDVVWNVSWSPTGNVLAVSDGTNKVTLWKEIATGEWVCVYSANNRGPAPIIRHICNEDCTLSKGIDKITLSSA